jgi:hypothetical protein
MARSISLKTLYCSGVKLRFAILSPSLTWEPSTILTGVRAAQCFPLNQGRPFGTGRDCDGTLLFVTYTSAQAQRFDLEQISLDAAGQMGRASAQLSVHLCEMEAVLERIASDWGELDFVVRFVRAARHLRNPRIRRTAPRRKATRPRAASSASTSWASLPPSWRTTPPAA